MLSLEAVFSAVVMLADDRHGLPRSDLGEAEHRDAVLLADLVVILRVHEGESEDTLLLQVGLVDSGEALREHHHDAEVTRFHSGVFTGRTFTVVVVADDDRLDALVLIEAGGLRGGLVVLVHHVPDALALAVEGVRRALEEVIGNPVDVAAVRKPLAPGGDVVRRALALRLNQQREIDVILAVPGRERGEEADTLGVRSHHNWDLLEVRDDAAADVRGEALSREFFTDRSRELEGNAVRARHRALQRVEAHVTVNRHRHHDFRRREESLGLLAAVVTAGEVAVEGLDDRVHLGLIADVTIPLADAGAAGGRHHGGVQLLELLQNAVTLQGFTNTDRARNHDERRLDLHALIEALLHD